MCGREITRLGRFLSCFIELTIGAELEIRFVVLCYGVRVRISVNQIRAFVVIPIRIGIVFKDDINIYPNFSIFIC